MSRTKQQATSGLILKTSTDGEKRCIINVLLFSFTTYLRTVPNVIGTVVKRTEILFN